MGRILILLGVLALCAGIVVPIASSLNMIGSFGVQIEDAITPTAAEYCNSGETLETTSGPSTRANSGSFQTARVTFYFCQNSTGERREVTDAVNRDLIGGPSGFLGNIGSIFTGGRMPPLLMRTAGTTTFAISSTHSIPVIGTHTRR